MNWTNTEKKIQLMELCQRFIDEHNVYDACDVYYGADVLENISGLLEEICNIIGYKESNEDE